jgi:hypothetical protein
MSENKLPDSVHPAGPLVTSGPEYVTVDTFGGKVRVTWDDEAPMTPVGQVVFFIDFLKTAGLYLPWVEGCPLHRTSPNAAEVPDVLGTQFLTILAGNWRYAHAAALRCDRVTPGLLNLRRTVSEDTIRRAFLNADSDACVKWQREHLRRTYEPLLYEPYILDLDMTVKPLYGRQEGAKVGYNPSKPGRPSHVLHTYFIANLRLVLDVEVHPGNETAACYTRPGLWRFLDGLPRDAWPRFLRGDVAFGNEDMMVAAEARSLAYVFKLRMSRNVKELVRLVSVPQTPWAEAGQGWEGVESRLSLQGWSRERRVVVLRRRLGQPRRRPGKNTKGGTAFLPFFDVVPEAEHYQYAILITSLTDPILALAQHYRDRGDAENNFDELKNQWAWGGFVTQDLKRTQIMARITAQIYNWWTIFVRLAVPDKHLEGTTSRPMLLHSIGRQTQHGHQTTLHLTAMHANRNRTKAILAKIGTFFNLIRAYAEQLPGPQAWLHILSLAFRWFLRGRVLRGSPSPTTERQIMGSLPLLPMKINPNCGF